MKRAVLILITIIMAITFAACGGSQAVYSLSSNAFTEVADDAGSNSGIEESETEDNDSDIPESETEAEGISWEFDESTGTITITGDGPIPDYDPGSLGEIPPWFDLKSKIHKLVIGDGITYIGDYAFSSCENLDQLSGAEGVAAVGRDSFFRDFLLCDDDGFFVLNNNLILWHMDENNAVNVPEGVTNIVKGCFTCGTSSYFETITLPDSLKSIEYKAFNYCPHLREIHIPVSVNDIAEGAINDCGSLEAITVDPANTNYVSRDGVLFTADMQTLLHYPCGSGADVYEVPDGITVISDFAFYGAESLEMISVPASVSSVGANSFGADYDLETINVDDANPAYRSVDGVLFDRGMSVLVRYPCGRAGTHYDIPDTVTVIGEAAFRSAQKLQTVQIPASVRTIEDSAFYSSLLTEMYIPENVTYIGSDAFGNMNYLESITLDAHIAEIMDSTFYATMKVTEIVIPEGVTAIHANAFQAGKVLSSVTLPSTLQFIEAQAFWYADALTDIWFNGTRSQWDAVVNDSLEADSGVWEHVTVHFIEE